MRVLTDERVGKGFETKNIKFYTHSTIFEDNLGTLTVAKSPRFTPTSKFIAVKYHWFRQHATGDDRAFDLKHVKSELQIADIFTKGVQGVKFLEL